MTCEDCDNCVVSNKNFGTCYFRGKANPVVVKLNSNCCNNSNEEEEVNTYGKNKQSRNIKIM